MIILIKKSINGSISWRKNRVYVNLARARRTGRGKDDEQWKGRNDTVKTLSRETIKEKPDSYYYYYFILGGLPPP